MLGMCSLTGLFHPRRSTWLTLTNQRPCGIRFTRRINRINNTCKGRHRNAPAPVTFICMATLLRVPWTSMPWRWVTMGYPMNLFGQCCMKFSSVIHACKPCLSQPRPHRAHCRRASLSGPFSKRPRGRPLHQHRPNPDRGKNPKDVYSP
jgi:hypothetical protein